MGDYQMKIVSSLQGPEIALFKSESDNVSEPILKGGGNDNYFCGQCGNQICRNVKGTLLKGLAFECPSCCELNLLAGVE